jgi:predicted lipoprotein with Yx(FWY)xxD motif
MDTLLFVSRARFRTSWSLLVLAVLIFLLAACGGTTSGSGTTYTTGGTTPTTSSSNGSGGRYGHGGGTTPTASTSGSVIKTALVPVNGTSKSILTNAQGMTLYYRTSDGPPSTVCSGGCASAWPPLVMSSSSTPTSAASLPGKLTIVTDANGNQVEYNGHPLYTYSGDTAAGQTNGEGVAGIWHVVTLSLT